MTPRTDISKMAWGRATVPMLLFFAFIAVFGVYPDKNFFWAHCRLAEWTLLFFLSAIFIKNVWFKSFLIFCLLRMILVFFQTPAPLAQKAGAASFIYFYYIFLFAVFYQTLDNVLCKEHNKLIVNGLCAIAILQTIYIWFQHFKIDPFFQAWVGAVSYQNMDVKDLVVGTWGHTNLSGAYLACSVPLFLRKRWWVAVPFLLTALFWGRSWGAIIACAGGIIFWIMATQKWSVKILLVVWTVMATLAYGSIFEHRQFNPLKSDRMRYLKPTIEMIEARPLIGWGLGQYKNAFRAINQKVFDSQIKTTHAHFDFIENLFENGIIGSLPIIGFLTALLICFTRNITEFSAPAMAGFIALLINSCSTFIFRTPLAWIAIIYLIIVKKEGELNHVA